MIEIDVLKKKIAEFDDALFGTRTPMPSGLYLAPRTYPTKGQHPRLNLTADMLPKISEVLKRGVESRLANNFWELADEDFFKILLDVG